MKKVDTATITITSTETEDEVATSVKINYASEGDPNYANFIVSALNNAATKILSNQMQDTLESCIPIPEGVKEGIAELLSEIDDLSDEERQEAVDVFLKEFQTDDHVVH